MYVTTANTQTHTLNTYLTYSTVSVCNFSNF